MGIESLIENLFKLLIKEPILSISLIFILIILCLWIFKDIIKRFLIKKFKLYSEEDIQKAITSINKRNIIPLGSEDIIEEIKRIKLSEEE